MTKIYWLDRIILYLVDIVSNKLKLGISLFIGSILLMILSDGKFINAAIVPIWAGITIITGYIVEHKAFIHTGILRINKLNGQLSIDPMTLKGKNRTEIINGFKNSIMEVKELLSDLKMSKINCTTHRSVIRVFLEVFGGLMPAEAKMITTELEKGQEEYLLANGNAYLKIKYNTTKTDPSYAMVEKVKYSPRRYYDITINLLDVASVAR